MSDITQETFYNIFQIKYFELNTNEHIAFLGILFVNKGHLYPQHI